MKKFIKILKRTGAYLSVGIVLGFFVAPMVWVLLCSFKPTQELLAIPPSFIPRNWTLYHYNNLFKQIPFTRYYMNSLLVASLTAVVSTVAGAMAAYSVYRCRYRGRGVLYWMFVFSYIFPKTLILIPLYVVMAKLQILNSPLAVAVAHITLTAPFSVWMLRTFFLTIPLEIEEAALVDGATRWQTLFRIFIPVSAPGIAAIGLNSFLMSWSEYLFASVLVIRDEYKTLPVGIVVFLQQYAIDWGIMMAASVLIAIPPVIAFAIAGKYFVQGLTAGSIK